LTAAFANAFVVELQHGRDDPFQLPWLVPVVAGAAFWFLLTGRDVRFLAKILLAIEGVGIVAMVVLSTVIFARGGAAPTGIDFSTFSMSGVSLSAVLSGVVAAFLSWAGFEACTSMGEETNNPRRNIPRALAGTLLLTGALFVPRALWTVRLAVLMRLGPVAPSPVWCGRRHSPRGIHPFCSFRFVGF